MPVDATDPLSGSIAPEFFEFGSSTTAADGWVHEKTVPYAIIAQAVRGVYGVTWNRREFQASENEAFVLPAQTPVRIAHHARPGEQTMITRWVHFRFSLFATFDLLSLLELPPVLTGEAGREMTALLAECAERMAAAGAAAAPDPVAQVVFKHAIAFRVLDLVFRAARQKPEAANRLEGLRRLEPVFAFIRRNLAGTIDVDELARRTFLSPSRFHACFKQATGLAPMRYVRQLRLDEARRRLSATTTAVQAIAEELGYASPFHFSRQFKQATGFSPTDFRSRAALGAV